jgi:hypothetical protein
MRCSGSVVQPFKATEAEGQQKEYFKLKRKLISQQIADC